MLMTKFVGKPYAGKLHVRFDEGVGKVFCLPALLYCFLFAFFVVYFSPRGTRRFSQSPQCFNNDKYNLVQGFSIVFLIQPLL